MRFRPKDVLVIGIPYLFLISLLNLFGYWGRFKINVLEFVGFSDVGKLAIYPLVAALAFVLIGMAIQELLHAPSFPSGGGTRS